MYQSIATKV